MHRSGPWRVAMWLFGALAVTSALALVAAGGDEALRERGWPAMLAVFSAMTFAMVGAAVECLHLWRGDAHALGFGVVVCVLGAGVVGGLAAWLGSYLLLAWLGVPVYLVTLLWRGRERPLARERGEEEDAGERAGRRRRSFRPSTTGGDAG